MDALNVSTTLTAADWSAYQGAWALRLQSKTARGSRLIVLVIAISAALATALALISEALSAPMPFIALVVGAALAALKLSFATRRLQRAASPDENGVVLGRIDYRFDANGIEANKALASTRYEWAALKDVTHTTEHLYVWIDRIAALIVPVRDLPAGLTVERAAECIRALASGAQPKLGDPVQSADACEAPATSPGEPGRPSLSGFLRAMGRVLTFRAPQARQLNASETTVGALIAAALGVWLLIDWLRAEEHSQFYVYGVVPLAWHACVVLAAAWLWSRWSEPRIPLRSTLAIALTLVIVALTSLSALRSFVPYGLWTGVLMVAALYATICGARALRTITTRHQPRAVFASLLLMAGAAWFGQQGYADARFLYPAYADEFADEEGDWRQWGEMGDRLFAQADRIDAAVAQFDRPADLPNAAFFLGFAGMGEQKVFAEEIALAEQVIGARFATRGRSLQLVNDRRDLDTHPLASPAAMRRALESIAARMDPQRDVLFIALSSHGSEDGALSVSNGYMPVANLTANDLADALQAADVRRRVVIVSACYSGTFIDPLRDEDTIVITAASADRNSFGCADDRDLTYFGEAFYRDALPSAVNLRDAYERAAAAIAEREKSEGKEPSMPQAHFGAEIEAYLRSLGSRPDGALSPPPQPSPVARGRESDLAAR